MTQTLLCTEPSFEQIVRDHQQMVFRTLLRLTGCQDSVDDLAQDVFLRLYRALPSFRGEALVSTYLYRITVNVAQDEWKRRAREDRRNVSLSASAAPDGEDNGWTWEDRLEHPGRNPEQELSDHEFQRAVDTHLMQLSAVERTVIVLYHQEERTYEQIAETLRIPLGTVRTHLHRGRKRLRDAISTSATSNEPRERRSGNERICKRGTERTDYPCT